MEHVGIEAISRGARRAILCDQSKEAIKIIQKNIEKTHTEQQIELYQTDFEQLLKTKIKEQVDIIYIDPPYKTDYAYQAVCLILDNHILAQNGLIIIETDEEKRVTEALKQCQIQITDKRKYGRVHLIFLKAKDGYIGKG